MKRIITCCICAFMLTICGGATCGASESGMEKAGQDVVDEQTVRDLVDLANKYEASGKLPRSAVVEGKPCPKGEAATCLLDIIGKVLDKSRKEGKESIPPEDLDKLAVLHEALKDELARQDKAQLGHSQGTDLT